MSLVSVVVVVLGAGERATFFHSPVSPRSTLLGMTGVQQITIEQTSAAFSVSRAFVLTP